MAASPSGEPVHAEGDNELAALNELAPGLATPRGSITGNRLADPSPLDPWAGIPVCYEAGVGI